MISGDGDNGGGVRYRFLVTVLVLVPFLFCFAFLFFYFLFAATRYILVAAYGREEGRKGIVTGFILKEALGSVGAVRPTDAARIYLKVMLRNERERERQREPDKADAAGCQLCFVRRNSHQRPYHTWYITSGW